jgi:galactokinase
MVAFVEEPMVDAFSADVRTRYATATGIEPEIYQVTAAAGAGMI